MNLKLLGALIGAGLTFVGGQKLYETWNSSKLVQSSFADFVKAKPGVGWYALTDGVWQLADAQLVVDKANKPNGEMYIAVHPRGKELAAGEKAQVVLHRTNKTEAELMTRAMDADEAKPGSVDPATIAKLLAEQPVKGMVEIGIDSDGDIRTKLEAAMGDRLAPGYLVISDGAEPPGYGTSIAALLAGLALLGFILSTFIRGRAPAAERGPEFPQR